MSTSIVRKIIRTNVEGNPTIRFDWNLIDLVLSSCKSVLNPVPERFVSYLVLELVIQRFFVMTIYHVNECCYTFYKRNNFIEKKTISNVSSIISRISKLRNFHDTLNSQTFWFIARFKTENIDWRSGKNMVFSKLGFTVKLLLLQWLQPLFCLRRDFVQKEQKKSNSI